MISAAVAWGMLVTGSPAAVASPIMAAAGVVATSGVKGPTHPDADYLGSTVAAHEGKPTRAQAQLAAPADVTTTPGLDVSHYQGTVDWPSVAAQGAKFAYMKASEGTSFVDPEFSVNYAGSAAVGLARGAYHFALPDESSGADQAMFFLNNGGGWVSDGHTLPPVLDIEYNPYGTSDWTGWCYGLTPAQLTAWISDFTTTIHDSTNIWPAIYTTNGWWSNCTGDDAGFGNDPLWIAPSSSDAGGPPTIPASWGAYTFFQYATSGTFPGDQDEFNGSVDQLTALATGSAPDKIVEHYTALGGSASSLGNPVGSEYPIAGGWAQDYDQGTIYYSPATGAWAVSGPILDHYRNLGGPGGALGFPTSDQTPTADGTGSYNDFAGSGGSSIYWSSGTGAWSVHGEIRNKWLALGGEPALGFPTTDEMAASDGVGRYNDFSGGDTASVYWSPNTGAHEIQGSIKSTWLSFGGVTGPGYPVTDETTTSDGAGRYNDFSNSTSISWSPSTGVHEVKGAIRDKWIQLGREGTVGFPTTDETGTPDGVGRYNHFSGYGGASIYWSPNTGAHEIQGAIRTQWASLGWETGLGYPITDETVTPDGVGRYNHFSGSASIYWSPSTGAWAVYGAIRDTWASLGWETSALGYPTSNEYGVPGGRRNDFQHGSITWYSATGTTTVTYN